MTTEYTNIYVKPFLKIEQRNKFSNFINDPAIFVPSVLHPDFSVQTEPKFYLEYGIEKTYFRDYIPAIYHNFYNKRFTFGAVKTAIAKENGVHVHDVVYIDVVDSMQGVNSEVSINGHTYFPSSINNMRNSLESVMLEGDIKITTDDSQLPLFMRTPQVGGYLPTLYIPVIILCYTLPKKSSIIVNRIKKSKFNFTDLDFEINRIIVGSTIDSNADKYLVLPYQTITDNYL